jgi:hypothetical protein
MSSFMLNFDGAKTFIRTFVRVIAPDNQQVGSLIPHADSVRAAHPISAQGNRHRFAVSYDPAGAQNRGQFRATVDDLPQATFALAPGVKQQQFSFTHFGLLNHLKSGSPMIVYFDDLILNGEKLDFSQDPKWEAHANHETFVDHDIAGRQHYGFCDSHFAGQQAGELGGTLWRSEKPSYYADTVGPFTLRTPLRISGFITLTVGAPDSGAFLAFFDSTSIKAAKFLNVLGIQIEGPSRAGHYVRPMLFTTSGKIKSPNTGPVIHPDGKPHRFDLRYTPPTATAAGSLALTFDDQQQPSVPVPPERADPATTFDRLGLLPNLVGGDQLQLFIDSLTYTSKPITPTPLNFRR